MPDPSPLPRPGARPAARPLPVPAVAAILLAVVVVDRLTKVAAAAMLAPGRRISYLGDLARLELVRNPGAFLGLGGSLPMAAREGLFTWGVAALTLGALVAAFRRSTLPRTALGAALVAAGGLGNLWDRATAGGLVVDFLNVGIGPVRTGVFNVADMAILAGVLALLLPQGRPRVD
jgi:signal peptidase II